MGDLRMNTARGLLVEYLVARAVDSPGSMRVEWAPWDVTGADGTRIEVKATGYSQSWHGVDSTPTWTFKSVRASEVWDESRGENVPVDPPDRVHVWVFALHLARRSEPYDPLDLSRWEFRVVPHAWLFEAGQLSARLSFFDRHEIKAVDWSQLPAAIKTARAEHERLRQSIQA